MMHQYGIRLMFHRRIQQRLAGRHSRHDALHMCPPFHLQAIWRVVLEGRTVEFAVDQMFQIEVTHSHLTLIQNCCRSPCSIRINFTPRSLP
ncbi:hypothetical protein D3C78_1496450 [compost metagenome]